MTYKPLLPIMLSLCFATKSSAQMIATLNVEVPQPTNGISSPASTNLDAITFLPDSVLTLVKIEGGKRTSVPFQIANGGTRTLYWMIDTDTKVRSVSYALIKGEKNTPTPMQAQTKDGAIVLKNDDQPLLQYNFKTVYPPAGVDTAYKRSGFIHPLWSPKGQVLTRIQPPDHYHHYGIWNPWTHVLFEKDTVDFWNIGDKKGTVRFANFLSLNDGAIFSEYEALHQHVAFKKGGGEKVAMNEVQSVRVYKPQGEEYYIADVTVKMSPASESPVLLLEYRYGGFGWRTTEQWNNKNSEVITSEGKNRKDADGSIARWCIVQGAIDNDYAGAVMMSYPTNYNYPEPLRIWPENQYNRGDMFANFAPTKNKDWLLTPGNTYTLKYRLLVFNGKFTKEKAETAWQHFAHAPKVTVNKSIK